MSGVKLADRLLVLGGSDTALIGALAGKAGLTGRTVVVDASPAVTSASATAVERDGHLIESFTAPWSMLPFDPHAFDVVVVRDVLNALSPEERLRCAQEVHRVLRPGGRAVVIEGKTQSLLGGLLGATPPVDPRVRPERRRQPRSRRGRFPRRPHARRARGPAVRRGHQGERITAELDASACCVPARAPGNVLCPIPASGCPFQSTGKVLRRQQFNRLSAEIVRWRGPSLGKCFARSSPVPACPKLHCLLRSARFTASARLPAPLRYPSVMSSGSLPPRRYRRSAGGS